MSSKPDLHEARDRLTSAQMVTILTGAGISADSGIPTFRGNDGLWRNFRAEDLATPEAFERNPRLVWEWYDWRRQLIAGTSPNAAHYAIAAFESKVSRFSLITQNVDGLHGQAGSRHILELHGDIWKVRCTHCHLVTDNRDVPLPLLPSCHACGKLLRPHIIWFGEALDRQILEASFRAAESSDVLLIVGTSGVVYPAAMLMPAAKAAGAFVIEVNLDPTPYSSGADLSFHGRASEIVPLLLRYQGQE